MASSISQIELKPEYFPYIASGQKSVDARANKPKYAHLKVGDAIEFLDTERKLLPLRVTIAYLRTYPTFSAMLQAEGVQKCLPDMQNLEEAVARYQSLSDYAVTEKEYGVLAIGIKPL